MSSKIEVSLADRLEDIAEDLTFMKDRNTIREAIALLAAPAVEQTLREHCKQCAEVVKTWPESKRDCLGSVVERQAEQWQRKSKMHGDCWYNLPADEVEQAIASGWEVRGLHSDPPELAELQATITRLTAEVERLHSVQSVESPQ
jgi:hypothetical protein